MKNVGYVYLLLLLIGSINDLAFSNSLKSIDRNKNTILFSIYNRMSGKDVEFYFNSLITTRTILSPGEMITETSNLDPKTCSIYMNQFCTSFHVYDPKIDGNNHDIVFMVTNNGVFYSLDDSGIWSRKSTWYHC